MVNMCGVDRESVVPEADGDPAADHDQRFGEEFSLEHVERVQVVVVLAIVGHIIHDFFNL